MRAICTLSLLSALLLSTQGFAAETPAAVPATSPAAPAAIKLSAKNSQTETFQAQVLAINLKDRLVTVRNEDSESIQLAAGDAVRNLEQLRAGDQVTVKATKSAVLQLKEIKGSAFFS